MSNSPKRILVVDDDPEIRAMLQIRLAKSGYEVATAEDGQSALDAMRGTPPHLVILDIMMPNMSGWEVAKSIRKQSDYDKVGIIVLTAIGEKMSEMTSPLMGADDHVDKPFDFAALEEKVQQVIAKRQG